MYAKLFTLLATAGVASMFFVEPPGNQKENGPDIGDVTALEKIGFVAGQITKGFDQGYDGVPPCHRHHLLIPIDTVYDPASCGSDFRKAGQTVGFNLFTLTRGYHSDYGYSADINTQKDNQVLGDSQPVLSILSKTSMPPADVAPQLRR